MGQQFNKHIKKKRRVAYLKRKKARIKSEAIGKEVEPRDPLCLPSARPTPDAPLFL